MSLQDNGMRILKTAAVIVVVFIVAVAAVGLFLPTKYAVERSVVIDATPEKVHVYVGDLRKWDEWSPWKEEDPSIVVTLGEKTPGVGASQSLDRGQRGRRAYHNTILAGERHGVDLLFDGGRYECKSSMKYSRLPDGDTKVTWTTSGDMGRSLTGGYFAILMDSMVGSMFERASRT